MCDWRVRHCGRTEGESIWWSRADDSDVAHAAANALERNVLVSHIKAQAKVVNGMNIYEMDQLDSLNDAQLWEVASDRHNAAEIRQEAIGRWLFPGKTNPDADPEDLGGGRLRELQQRASVLESDEINENDTQDAGEMAPYFDSQGRLILEHDGVSYLVDTLDDDGTYFGMSNRNNLYTTDDKTNMDRDL